MAAALPCLIFLISMGSFTWGAFPSITVGDSGEFATAAATLGIPHPPGYPLYVLLGRISHALLPWANAGYRSNLFSALCGALAVTIFFLALRRSGCGVGAAFFGAFLLLCSFDFRIVSQATEVFALHTLFIVLIFWSVAAQEWLLAAFIVGLGAANHQTILLIVPAVCGVHFFRPPAERRWSSMSLAGLLGLSVYAFVYFRAGQTPFLNVGQPDSLERFWRVFTRANYGSLTLALGEAPPRTLATTLAQLERLLHGLMGEISAVGVLAAVGGACIWWKKDRRLFWFLVAGFVMFGPLFFLLGNLPFDAQSSGILGRFFVAPALFGIALAAVLLDSIGNLGWLVAAAPLLLLIPQKLTAQRMDFSAYSYGRNNLRTLPMRAMLVMDGGDDTFYSLAYLTQVEHRRPDVELHDRGGVVFANLYGPGFLELSHDAKEVRRQSFEHSLLTSRRPFYYSTLNPEVLAGVKLRQEGILYAATPSPLPTKALWDPLWSFYDLRGIAPWVVSSLARVDDYRQRALLPFYAYQRGVELGQAGDVTQGMRYFQSARSVGSDVVWLLPNIANLVHLYAYGAIEHGELVLSGLLYAQLVRWNPNDVTAWMNWGGVMERMNRLPEAIKKYRRAVELEPNLPRAHYNLAVGYWKESRWQDVVSELERVAALDPTYPGVSSYLQQARARLAR